MSNKELRDTLNLPKTDFPMRAGLPKNEPIWQQRWDDEDIYNSIREQRKGKEPFVLHSGPPYANGNLHIGHALNISLKDFVVRSQNMLGRDATFVVGMDCHGLPIEWKIEEGMKQNGQSKKDFTTAQMREKCRTHAGKWVEEISSDFHCLGILADLKNPYLTMNAKNEAGIIRELGKMAEKGLVYRGSKSIMWSTVEETSLAEAEVEYADKESKAVYVKFKVVGDKDNHASVVIWTTTPWTLPANQAVAYGRDIEYVLLKATQVNEKASTQSGECFWVAESLVEHFCLMTGIESHEFIQHGVENEVWQQTPVLERPHKEDSSSVSGNFFASWQLQHPLFDKQVPMIKGFHVTTDAGTGFVHIAPSHGPEDFQIGQENDLDLICHVQGDGTYDETVPPLKATGQDLAGHDIWKSQDRIISEMIETKVLMRWYKIKHSYPVSWRSKAPLIYRTTPQWYIALDKEIDGQTVREIALAEIAKIGKEGGWVPAYGENRIKAMMEGRPDWCISRQRAWGVPITIFQHIPSGEYVFDKEVFEHIASLVAEEGIDVWETKSTAELLPEGYLASKGWKAEDLEKETDILDVWFDSGTSYAHVVEEMMGVELPVDLYLEGSDMHRGWFNSSLTASCATRGHAPYKQVLTHGFVVDGKGKKMSKSVGNVVTPGQVMKKYGMDILRLWAASSDYSEDIRYSDEIIKGTADSYRRFRNSFRFLLGNLYDFDEEQHAIAYSDMPELEQWLLSKMHIMLAEVQDFYKTYQFRRAYEVLHNFCSKELSNLYFDIRKDSLYCDPRMETEEGQEYYHRRRCCQTVLMHLLKGLTTHLAPIMPFTTDEVWRAAFGEDKCVHLEEFNAGDKAWHSTDLEAKWEKIWEVRDEVNAGIEALRQAGTIGHNYEIAATLPDDMGLSTEVWQDILVISHVTFGEKIHISQATGLKCERSWKYVDGDQAVSLDGDIVVSKRDSIALKANALAAEAAV